MNLEAFRAGFKGVRANRFKVTGAFPNAPGAQQGNAGLVNFEFYCKAASIPGSGIGIIPVGYKGRPVKFSGERTYQDWIIQVYDSSTPNIRKLFEDWVDYMDRRNAHEVNYNTVINNQWLIEYMDMSGSQSNSQYRRKFTLKNCWPVDVSAIEVSYDIPDTFAEFTVTLTYDFFEVV